MRAFPRRLVRDGRLHARRQGCDDPDRGAADGCLASVAGKVYDELIDNYSTDGRFDPEGLQVLVDSLVEMGALKSADVKAYYTEEYLPSR